MKRLNAKSKWIKEKKKKNNWYKRIYCSSTLITFRLIAWNTPQKSFLTFKMSYGLSFERCYNYSRAYIFCVGNALVKDWGRLFLVYVLLESFYVCTLPLNIILLSQASKWFQKSMVFGKCLHFSHLLFSEWVERWDETVEWICNVW